ncbi:MAG: hypothetical protein HFP77_03110 [Methylococcales symbiont of Iophon sp. n. MRB-2018]|nr:MAG: hypothetical protein HFP77_03110 [Methylococcales symbiont of Iophon sp. n. MRB-2018]KAF3980328.1 MAG: hypothetical protein HFP76_02600 [Methylococcales symbiont of Iophon sp. n. MRB-2018]
MTTVITSETLKSGINKSIFNAEKQVQIRNRLKEAVGYDVTDQSIEKKFNSEIHNEKSVPFEGSVYTSSGNSLNTKEINKRYKQSVPTLWWLVTQSLVTNIRRLLH